MSSSASTTPSRDLSSPSRDKSRSLSQERSHSKERSRSLERRPQSRSRSRSQERHTQQRSAIGDSRTRQRSITSWRQKLDELFSDGILHQSDIDDDTMHTLEEMNEELANTVITRFSEVNFSRVTNISGFLMGIVRRVQQDGSGSGTNELEELPRPMRQRMLDLVDSGRLHQSDIDPRMTRTLKSLPVNLAMDVLDKFAYADLDNVRSKTGFMLGIVKRLQGEDEHRQRRMSRRDRYR